jgi:hypothetical protein
MTADAQNGVGAMAHYILRIIKRSRPNETRGLVSERIEFDAENDYEAQSSARVHLGSLDWRTHFAALGDDARQFVWFWSSSDS